MRFKSTRKNSETVDFLTAVTKGLADDGGLFVPASWERPAFRPFDLSSFAAFSGKLLTDILSDPNDHQDLESVLKESCASAFNFEFPVRNLSNHVSILELFHGPTAAFKDFGARFLAALMSHIPVASDVPTVVSTPAPADVPNNVSSANQGPSRERLIVVATSGDTGGAVAAAFDQIPGHRVLILYPKGRVSNLQEMQLTCWGQNIQSVAVHGSFDDCQRLAKELLLRKEVRKKYEISSANSINIGRLLPQFLYYYFVSLKHFEKNQSRLNFIIPTGNMGNAFGALWAKAWGAPIDEIVLSTNANDTLWRWSQSKRFDPKPSQLTPANAMDVGNPSNFERYVSLNPNGDYLSSFLSVVRVDDQDILSAIGYAAEIFGFEICPHTATAMHAFRHLDQDRLKKDWTIVSTAHPSKFSDVVEPITKPLLERPVALSEQLGGLLSRKTKHVEAEAKIENLVALL